MGLNTFCTVAGRPETPGNLAELTHERNELLAESIRACGGGYPLYLRPCPRTGHSIPGRPEFDRLIARFEQMRGWLRGFAVLFDDIRAMAPPDLGVGIMASAQCQAANA